MHERTPKLKSFPSRLNLVLFVDLFLKGHLKCRNRPARCGRFENNGERVVLNNNSSYARSRMAIEEEGRQEKGLRERQASEAIWQQEVFWLGYSGDLLEHFFTFRVFLSIKVDEHWVDFLLTHGGSFCVVWAVWVGMERLQVSAFACMTRNCALVREALSIQWKLASVGIDPQIEVKFCNFRTQKAVFLITLYLNNQRTKWEHFFYRCLRSKKEKNSSVGWKPAFLRVPPGLWGRLKLIYLSCLLYVLFWVWSTWLDDLTSVGASLVWKSTWKEK